MSFEEKYDFVVVGGGSSGCIVASRLAKAGVGRVLLLEAGDWAEKNPETLSSDGFIHAFANDKVMWDRLSSPQEHCGGRSLYLGSGTGMGGSGSVNGMVYTRGDKKDFDQWPLGWRWQDVEPYFKNVEQIIGVKPRAGTSFTETCIAAAKQSGFKHKNELIDGDLCGYLGYQTMNYDGDIRRSSYVSFIKDQNIANLTVKTNCKVTQIIFDKSKRSTGVIFNQNGQARYVSVEKEVVLTCGALETPKILMLSGVGPMDELGKHGIECVVESENIGKNLHDHPNVCVFFKGKRSPDSKYPQLYGFNRVNNTSGLAENQADTCYVFYSAPASLKHSMKRMLPAVLLPSKVFHNKWLRSSLRACVDLVYSLPVVSTFLSQLYGVVVILGKPESRGRLTLKSTDPLQQADISPNYYQVKTDMDTMVKGVELATKIAHQNALVEWGNTPLVAGARTKDRNKIAKWIRSATMTTFHYCGTCKLGSEPADPVDLELRLRGVKGLRVADASIIPETPVSALNAPSMMIGYRASEFLINAYSKPKGKSTQQNKEHDKTLVNEKNGADKNTAERVG